MKTLQIQSFSTEFVEHPGDCCQMTSRENPENPESNRCELTYVLYILIFLLQSAQNQPSHVECTFETQLSWLDTGTPLDASAVKAAITQVPSRDHTEQCRTRIIQAMSSDVDLSAREAHEIISRAVSDAEPNTKIGAIC